MPSQVQAYNEQKSASAQRAHNGTDNGDESDYEYMDDLRIQGYDPLIAPHILSYQLPLSTQSKRTIAKARAEAIKILSGEDDRVILVVGPCSIHDVAAALEYASKLKELVQQDPQVAKNVLILMRTYFEKPRTTVGWKGLLNDAYLDGSFRINDGLRIGRKLLCDITQSGVPVACELLDTISPQYIADCVSWAAIGARTTESQLHRELASGVSFPIGFKNGTDGNIDIAIDAIRAAAHPHRFVGVTHQGLAAITRTSGNKDCHIILRGGKSGTNYDQENIRKVNEALNKHKLQPKIMVDCSHGNSNKNHKNQVKVLESLCDQLRNGDTSIAGVMVESNLIEGAQKIPADGNLGTLAYGQSITDACVGWDETVAMIKMLAEAVEARRVQNKSNMK
ncbi:hypothetical protein MIR68_008955 [Amoeboaphelidium protococcarum]|nr:hypothetical protein MIR68_008955 [Amoeboaphelidium protococcarum]